MVKVGLMCLNDEFKVWFSMRFVVRYLEGEMVLFEDLRVFNFDDDRGSFSELCFEDFVYLFIIMFLGVSL